MDLTPYFITAFAALTAAGVAAFASLVATILAKEQKTSEFRQQWIDALGNDLAAFLGEATVVADYSRKVRELGLSSAETLERKAERYSNFTKILSLATRIELRLNPNEDQALIQSIHKVIAHVYKPSDDDTSDFTLVRKQAQALLKKEWTRVKKGEPAFYITKWTIIAIVAAFVLAIGFAGWAAYSYLDSARIENASVRQEE